MDYRAHWENVYRTKGAQEVSWYQPDARSSLELVAELQLPKSAAIIDVGGGDSFLAERLLELGYTDITVLDISETALRRAQDRLGEKASLVKWIVADVTNFVPARKYDCWHDRAVFHFLGTRGQQDTYMALAHDALSAQGKMILGAFSESGPGSCSGLPVTQYSEARLTETIRKWFHKIKCLYTEHLTPFNTRQHFLFCSFQKNSHGLS